MHMHLYITTNWCGDNSIKPALSRQALTIIGCATAAPSFSNSSMPMLTRNQLTATTQK